MGETLTMWHRDNLILLRSMIEYGDSQRTGLAASPKPETL